MNDYENFKTWLYAEGFKDWQVKYYANTIKNIKDLGIPDDDILHRDVRLVAEDYSKLGEKHYKTRTLNGIRYMIRKYRQFIGVEV